MASDNGLFVPAPVRVIDVASGNLFSVAAEYLGDATKWYQIAKLNPQLDGDPFFDGIVSLTLPVNSQPSNGGLVAVI